MEDLLEEDPCPLCGNKTLEERWDNLSEVTSETLGYYCRNCDKTYVEETEDWVDGDRFEGYNMFDHDEEE